MKDKEVKTLEKRGKTNASDVSDFITKTGFILEMEVSELLKKNGYKVDVNRYFFDYDENKKREIDIIASKKINEIEIVFVIECKQSVSLDWVFVCSDKSPSRYYSYIKYFPETPYKQSIDVTKVFDHLRPLSHKIPLAQNSIVRHYSGKQSESRDIYECLTKLPKSVVGVVEETGIPKKKRIIFLPLVVFSGQIFTVEYENKLKVKEVNAVQYAVELDSEAYSYHYLGNNRLSLGRDNRNSPVAEMSRKLGSKYLIDFITKNSIKSFLTSIENEVAKVDLSLWPIEVESNSN